MKRIILLITAIAISISIISPAYASSFSDYKPETIWSLDKFNFMEGYEDGTFRPNNPITRAEFTRALMKAAYAMYDDLPHAEIEFSDLDKSHWAYNDIMNAVSIGVISGFEDGTFRADDNVTYEQACAMIFNLLGYQPVTDLYGGYPHAYISLAYYNNFFQTSIDKRAGAIKMDESKQKQPMVRGDALTLLDRATVVPICVVTDYEISWDGSQKPIYHLGGDGDIELTVSSIKDRNQPKLNK